MGRKVKWPPAILRHKASGRDRIRVKGVDYWLGPSGSEEARREYARLVGELAGGGQAPRRSAWPTVRALAAAWAERRMPACAAKEAKHFRRALDFLLASGRGDLPADRLKAAQLAEARAAMVAAGWCRTYCNHQVSRLRTVWRWAEESQLAPEGSWNHLRTLRPIPVHDRSVRHAEKRRPAAREHLDLVLPRIRAAAVRAMLTLQYLTGMRSGETRSMRAGEVDRSREPWLYRPAAHKNAWRGQARVVPLGPEAQKVLAPWLCGKAAEAYLFLTRGGRPYSSEEYARIVRRAADKVGLDWLQPYSFRHGAKDRITRELGLDHARAALGQKHLGTAAGYGEAVDLKLAEEAARRTG